VKLEELRNMPSGKELNALTCEKILGYEWMYNTLWPKTAKCILVPRRYVGRFLGGFVIGKSDGEQDVSYCQNVSGSWAGMGLVVDAMTERGMALRLDQVIPNSDPCFWMASFGVVPQCGGDTAPHAICIAALVAVGAYDEYEPPQPVADIRPDS